MQDDEMASASDDDATEMIANASMTFGEFLSDRIDEMVSESDEMSFKRDAYEALASDTDMSAVELRDMVEGGELLFPPDSLVAAVADMLGVSEQDIRTGQVDGLSGESDTPDVEPDEPQPVEPMESSNDESVDNSADSGRDGYTTALEQRVVELEMQARGVDCDDQNIDGLIEMRRRTPDVYENALDVLERGSDSEPVESSARGTTGDSATTSADADAIEAELRDDGVEEGSMQWVKRATEMGHPDYQF